MYIITDEIHSDEDAEKALKKTCDYYESMCQKLLRGTENEGLTFSNAKNWFDTLPLRYAENYYPEEVNQVIDKCFKLLYKYCIRENLIKSSITYEEFYDGKGLHDENYPISRWYGENGPLGKLLGF